MKFNFLPVFNGDAIHLSYEDAQNKTWNILIDGGPSPAYSKKGKKGQEYGALFDLIDALKQEGQIIDLLILTHIDDDHVDGLLQWMKYDANAVEMIGRVWYNSGKLIAEYLGKPENDHLLLPLYFDNSFETSVPQAVDFEDYIKTKYTRNIILAGTTCTYGELKFQFLSPGKQKLIDLLDLFKKKAPAGYFDTSGGRGDYSKTIKSHIQNDVFVTDTRIANGSSIAFILIHKDKNYLFLGDSHPGLIVEELLKLEYSKENPVPVEFVKISHHGSSFNTCPELLKLIETNKYVISTHGQQHGHPDKDLIARIIAQNPNATIAFNYPDLINFIFLKQDYADFPDFKTGDANDIINNNG